MKKLSLLLIAGSMALSAGAQALHTGSASFGPVDQGHQPLPVKNSVMHNGHSSSMHNGHRTTSSTMAWYNYVLYMDTTVALGSTSATAVDQSAPYLWNDTTSQDAYTTGTFYNNMVSYGMVFDPTFSGYSTYFDVPALTSSTPYWVDSVGLYAVYGTNPAKTGIVDTLKVGYVYGSFPTSGDDIYKYWFTNASVLANYSVTDTALFFAYFGYDSAKNTGASLGTNPSPTYKEQILTISTNPSSNSNINWGDTLSNGIMYHAFKLDIPAAVPAGQIFGYSISFKSGDASFTAGDVVFTSTGTYNYNMWRPLVAYYSDGTSPVFFTYNAADFNCGQFKTLPNSENGWGDIYVPMYAWTAGGGASTLQYPVIDFHVRNSAPPSTGVAGVVGVGNVQVVPNPAANFTFINFKLDAVANVNVSLIDAAGQLVNTQHFDNVASGKAFINTTDLASGVYFYTVSANGKNSTGRVVIAH